MQAADGISLIVYERYESNAATNKLPLVLPNELCRIDMREFVKLLQSHREGMLPFLASIIMKRSAGSSVSFIVLFETSVCSKQLSRRILPKKLASSNGGVRK
jgi:hypothetical protein